MVTLVFLPSSTKRQDWREVPGWPKYEMNSTAAIRERRAWWFVKPPPLPQAAGAEGTRWVTLRHPMNGRRVTVEVVVDEAGVGLRSLTRCSLYGDQ
jgi:hypothetical protein